jgi:hypothetical protein
LKPEWWGSPLVQEEKYQEKPVEREEITIIISYSYYDCDCYEMSPVRIMVPGSSVLAGGCG